MSTVVELHEVSRTYGSPPTTALNGVSLTVSEGEMVAIVGPSGSGKSTLLNIIGTLDRATSGRTRIAGHDVAELSDAELSGLRGASIGFVFQQFHLAEGISALENVATGMLYTGVAPRERRRRALRALERVGLRERAHHKPPQLSGGERQRVAIARAVVGEPAVLLADEPTGSLDSRSGATVMEVLAELHAGGTTVLLITHDQALADRMPRQVRVRDGLIVADTATDDRTTGSTAGASTVSGAIR